LIDPVVAFYHNVLGLRILEAGPRLVAMEGGQGTVLLLFKRGATVAGRLMAYLL